MSIARVCVCAVCLNVFLSVRVGAIVPCDGFQWWFPPQCSETWCSSWQPLSLPVTSSAWARRSFPSWTPSSDSGCSDSTPLTTKETGLKATVKHTCDVFVWTVRQGCQRNIISHEELENPHQAFAHDAVKPGEHVFTQTYLWRWLVRRSSSVLFFSGSLCTRAWMALTLYFWSSYSEDGTKGRRRVSQTLKKFLDNFIWNIWNS